jgi:CMP-N-acetylneuraminic acid synthetase
MRVLGIIPARGGSKSIPLKNIALLAGRPLLAYTAEAALASRHLARTILSTDSPEIAKVGRDAGLEVPFLRPAKFAGDQSPAIDAIRHALSALAASESFEPDAVMLLQPTSPLRRAEHIDAAIELLRDSGADSVVSVVPVPHQFNPVSLMKRDGDRLVPWMPGQLITRRQDKPLVYARNGPAILLTRASVLLEQNRLYGDDCRPLIMHPADSLDIDDAADLEYVEYVIGRRRMPASQVA